MTTSLSLSQWEGCTWPLGLRKDVLGEAEAALCFLPWLPVSAWLAWLSSDLSIHLFTWLPAPWRGWPLEQGERSQVSARGKLTIQGAARWASAGDCMLHVGAPPNAQRRPVEVVSRPLHP